MAGEAYEYDEDVKPVNTPDLGKDEDKDKDKPEDKNKKEETKDKPADKDEPELTEAEQQAYAQGWRPKEEWSGDPDKWVDANEFIFRGELMDRIQKQTKVINNQNAELTEVKEALKVLAEHNKQIAEKEYNRALATLKKQRREALRESDHETVDELEERIDELKEAKQEADKESSVSKDTHDKSDKNTQSEVPPIVGEWLDKNKSWYDSNVALKGAADAIFLSTFNQETQNFEEAFEAVDKQMREQFPEVFGKKRTQPGPSVGESNGRAKSSQKGNKSKFTARDLNEEQHGVAKTFVETGVFKNMQEYVDQLAELGELDAQQ